MDNLGRQWVPRQSRSDAILYRHLKLINSDIFLNSELKKLGLEFKIENFNSGRENPGENSYLYDPVLSSINLGENIHKNPVGIIGVCLVPKGRFQLHWQNDKNHVGLDMYLAYKEINQYATKQIQNDTSKQILLDLFPKVKPILKIDMNNDPTLGRIIKYLRQLEVVNSMNLSEVHFLLPNILYSMTLIDNARSICLSENDVQTIEPLVNAYAERERKIIQTLIKNFFPNLFGKVKVIIPTDKTYANGLQETSHFTNMLNVKYEQIPLDERAMSYFVKNELYADHDLLSMRLWMSDSTGKPVFERPTVIIGHTRSIRPTGRFLIQSIKAHNQVYNDLNIPPLSTSVILTTSSPSIFHQLQDENLLYWETERPNDDDYNSLPGQCLRIGDGEDITISKMEKSLVKENNKSIGQSYIYLILRDSYYFLNYYCRDNRARLLTEPLYDILSNWETPRFRKYSEGLEIIPKIIGFLKELIWCPMDNISP